MTTKLIHDFSCFQLRHQPTRSTHIMEPAHRGIVLLGSGLKEHPTTININQTLILACRQTQCHKTWFNDICRCQVSKPESEPFGSSFLAWLCWWCCVHIMDFWCTLLIRTVILWRRSLQKPKVTIMSFRLNVSFAQLTSFPDQMLPLFVMETLGELPGLSGLFIAGVFSAALSSLSTCLNSMSAVVLEDFVKPSVKQPLTENMTNWVMRSVVVVIGVICVGMVYIVEKMGTVLQLTMSLEAITNGPLLGIFTLGIFVPWIKSRVSSGCWALSWLMNDNFPCRAPSSVESLASF